MTLRVVLTGGGSAGHVLPHLAMLPAMRARSWELLYLGSNSLEENLVKEAGLNYRKIASGKLRRYFSWHNFMMPFLVLIGVLQAAYYLRTFKAERVLAKGGFVSVPVALAAFLLRIPIYSHESDLSPGLATKIIAKMAKRVFCTFPETVKTLGEVALYTGLPIRPEIAQGQRQRALERCSLSGELPVLLCMGGSQGAESLNTLLLDSLDSLLEHFQVIHIHGPGKSAGPKRIGYVSFASAFEGIADIWAACDIFVGRAGANTIFEGLSLNKPMLLLPLRVGSRGDQVENARSLAKKGWARIWLEGGDNGESFLEAVVSLYQGRGEMVAQQAKYEAGGSPGQRILDVVES